MVSDTLPTHFDGFVLLTTLPHGSLHTRYGHVLPWYPTVNSEVLRLILIRYYFNHQS